MTIKLENPTLDTIAMIRRSWPPALSFFYNNNQQQLIITCDNYINDFQAQAHLFTYRDNHIKITMVLPYTDCPKCTKLKEVSK